MNAPLFSEVQLDRLRRRFGAERTDGEIARDVDRLAAQCAAQHVKARYQNPYAMLSRWLEVAEVNDTDRLVEQKRREATQRRAVRSFDGLPDPGVRSSPEVAREALEKIFEMLNARSTPHTAAHAPPPME